MLLYQTSGIEYFLVAAVVAAFVGAVLFVAHYAVKTTKDLLKPPPAPPNPAGRPTTGGPFIAGVDPRADKIVRLCGALLFLALVLWLVVYIVRGEH